MSGLCGWFSRDPAALPIEQMAAPLAGFDPATLRVGEHGAGVLAMAGRASGSMLHEDGLLVACWGEPADTVARLWRSHGPKACAALSGSFVFALLDERRDEALLAVDRSGARPLYFQQAGRTLAFATSAEALARHPGAGRAIDPQSLYNYLYFHGVPAPASVYKGQRRLLAGESLHLQGGRVARTRYWQLQFHESVPAAEAELRQELVDSIAGAGLAACGPGQGGVLLSGGIGSAALAALLAGAGGAPVRTYSIGYEGDEAAPARARAVARQLGSVHRERTVSAAEVADAIPQLAAGFDQPLGEPAALATFYSAQLAREDGVARLLGAHGAAELFGARLLYSQQARLSQYEKIPSALRQTLVEPLLFQLAAGVRGAPLRRARSYVEQAMAGLPARLQAANLLHGYGSAEVLEADFLAGVDPTAPAALLGQSWWQGDGASQVNQLIALDLKYALADLRLPAATTACALAGLEAAFPFMDDTVVAFAARLAPRLKLDGVRGSPFLREALRAVVPRKALARRGTTLPPFGHWLQADPRVRSLALDSLADLKRRRIVRPAFIDALLVSRMAARPPHYGKMVWLLMMLEQWLGQRRFGALHTPLVRKAEDEAETAASSVGWNTGG